MDSFQAKTARHRPRMIYKKKISFGSIPTRSGIGNSKKNSKKIQKTKKNHYGFFSSQNGMGQAKNDGKKKKKRSYQFLANPEYRILKK